VRLSTIIYYYQSWTIIIILLLFVPWKIGTKSSDTVLVFLSGGISLLGYSLYFGIFVDDLR
jgi:hypothetical protein